MVWLVIEKRSCKLVRQLNHNSFSFDAFCFPSLGFRIPHIRSLATFQRFVVVLIKILLGQSIDTCIPQPGTDRAR